MVADMPASVRRFRRRGAPAAVMFAVDGIAKACVPDPDALLYDLLSGAIAEVRAIVRPATAATAPQRPGGLVASAR
jgi:hypothetical protein